MMNAMTVQRRTSIRLLLSKALALAVRTEPVISRPSHGLRVLRGGGNSTGARRRPAQRAGIGSTMGGRVSRVMVGSARIWIV